VEPRGKAHQQTINKTNLRSIFTVFFSRFFVKLPSLLSSKVYPKEPFMSIALTQHTNQFSTSPQLTVEQIAEAAALGFKTIINNRPDGEAGAEQPLSSDLAREAAKHGISYHHIPVISGQMTQDNVIAMKQLLAQAQAPVLAFCRSGTRSTNLWRSACE
jgi:uncharacterized protein (TIGR01244 family)